jgi:LysM repeat protein
MSLNIDKKNTSGTVPYTIKEEDSIYKISRYYNISLDDLIETNPHIDPDNIKPGDIIYLPIIIHGSGCPTGSIAYSIKPGDTIYKLSRKFDVSVNTLLKSNSRVNPDALLPGQIIYIPKTSSLYTNKEYKISLKYPTRWAKVDNLHYEGVDGFFRISAMYSELALEELGSKEAHHRLKPYGSNPVISTIQLHVNWACVIIPSADQPMEMKRQSAILIKLNSELEIKSNKYNHLIIWTDKDHLDSILKSIRITSEV